MAKTENRLGTTHTPGPSQFEPGNSDLKAAADVKYSDSDKVKSGLSRPSTPEVGGKNA